MLIGMPIEVIRTADGSSSLRLVELDECYHSRRGAWNESMHVYIRNGFEAWLEQHPASDSIRVFEMGFGTGLNTMLTVGASIGYPKVHVDYRTVELNPVPEELWRLLEFPENGNGELLSRLHAAPFGKPEVVAERFSLTKYRTDIRLFEPQEFYDVIYFDAFGPRAQPELWTDQFLQRIAGWLNPDGMLVTYCTKGVVKRSFRRGGFRVDALPGPPGKREMLRVMKGAFGD